MVKGQLPYLAKKVKKVTGIDSSTKRLELLNQRACQQNIENVYTILKSLEEITYDEIGDYDIVLASRSLNGIIPIEETLKTIDKIANKYVFIIRQALNRAASALLVLD